MQLVADNMRRRREEAAQQQLEALERARLANQISPGAWLIGLISDLVCVLTCVRVTCRRLQPTGARGCCCGGSLLR